MWGLAGECCGSEIQAYISWAFSRVSGKEIARFTGHCMFRLNKTSYWCKIGAEGVDCVSDVITEDFLAVFASEEMVSILVKGLVAVKTRNGGDRDGETKLALEESLEDFIV